MKNKISRFLALMGVIFTITISVIGYQWLTSLPQSTQTLFVGGVSGSLLTLIACLAGLTPVAVGAWLATQWHLRQQRRQYYPPQLRQRYPQPPQVIMMPGQMPMLPPSFQQQPSLFTSQNQQREFEIIGEE